MFKRLLMLIALLSAFMVLPGAAQAGLFITVDIDNNSTIEGWFQVDPVPSNPFGPLTLPLVTDGAAGGLTVSVTVNTFESASTSFVGTLSATVDNTGGVNITTGSVRIQALWTEVLLPGGSPLLLGSTITTPDISASTLGSLVTATNTSYLDNIAVVPGVPDTGPPGVAPAITTPAVGGLVALIPTGPSFPIDFIDAAFAPRDRPGLTFDLLSDILINFDLSTAGSLQISTQTSASSVPELSSVLAWGLVAVLGLMIAGRRKRAA
jgi:hypothetical protein